MTTPTAPRNLNSRPRNVRFTRRDGGALLAEHHLADGQAIAPFLSSRKGGWLNITIATWEFEGVRHAHAVLQDDDIAWASSSDPDVRVNQATPNGETHEMDFLLDDRTRLRGSIVLAARQGISR